MFKCYQCFIISLFLFTFAGIFTLYMKSLTIVCCGLALVLFFIPFFLEFQQFKMPSNSKFFNVLYFLLLIWEVYIILYPYLLSSVILPDGYSLRVDYTLPAYFLPLLLLIKRRTYPLDKTFLFLKYVLCLSLIVAFFNKNFWFEDYSDLAFDDYQEALLKTTPLMGLLNVGLIVLPFTLFTKDNILKGVAFICAFLCLLFYIVAARRGGLMTGLLYVVIYVYIGVFYGKKRIPKWVIFVVVALGMALGVYMLLSSSLASYLMERGMEDSRSFVELFFLNDFGDNYMDWLFGRGINGTYYCPLFTPVQRQIIETGFLFMILKGGLVYLLLYVLLFAHAIWKGFRSHSVVLKIMAMELSIRLLTLYPFGLPAFGYTDFFCWIFILYCETSGKLNNVTASAQKNKLLKSSFLCKRNITHI